MGLSDQELKPDSEGFLPLSEEWTLSSWGGGTPQVSLAMFSTLWVFYECILSDGGSCGFPGEQVFGKNKHIHPFSHQFLEWLEFCARGSFLKTSHYPNLPNTRPTLMG